MTERYLTQKDLQDIIPTLGRTGAYALMRRDDFPSFRIGRKLFVAESAFHKWLADGGTKNDMKTAKEV